MRIGIVTVYNSMNDGSFWQSMMLKRELEKRGHSVAFFELPQNPERPALTKTIVGRIIKYLVRDGAFCCYKYIKSVLEFRDAQNQFYKMAISEAGQLDLVVLGSDMIWCREEKPFFDKYHEFFWGEMFHSVPIATYAGSCGNMRSYSDQEWIRKAINRWKMISVRDNNTYRIIQSNTEKTVNIVCDPTLLATADEYASFMRGYVSDDEKYILLYMFSNLTPAQGEQIISFAKDNNLNIVSLIRRQRYFPRHSSFVAINSPFRLIEYYAKAKYVITDTFHGSLFAILFNKQFVTLDLGKAQVNEVVDALGYRERIVDRDELFLETLTRRVDFCGNEGKLNSLRSNSLDYLDKMLGMVNGHI